MTIASITECSLIDYPGHLAAVLFTRGCNFRCRYCYNPGLVLPKCYVRSFPLEKVYTFLESRKDLLEGICITGGEPTEQRDLPEFIRRIKKMGFLVKLDTNGTRPKMLHKLISEHLLDYIAMDVKAPIDEYERIVGWSVPEAWLRESIDSIKASGVAHEFRTTVVPSLLSYDDLELIASTLRGAQRYFLQPFVSETHLLDKTLRTTPCNRAELLQLIQQWKGYFEYCGIRG